MRYLYDVTRVARYKPPNPAQTSASFLPRLLLSCDLVHENLEGRFLHRLYRRSWSGVAGLLPRLAAVAWDRGRRPSWATFAVSSSLVCRGWLASSLSARLLTMRPVVGME